MLKKLKLQFFDVPFAERLNDEDQDGERGDHPRSAYRHTVENSIYVHHEHQRCGAGSRLLRELVVRARDAGHRAIIAGIDGEQAGSMALHAKFGFELAGRLKGVGLKFGRWLDVVYMELRLEAGSGGKPE